MTESTLGKQEYRVRVRKVVEYDVVVKPGEAGTRAKAKAHAEDQIEKAHNGDGTLISVTGYAKWEDH